MAAPGLDHSTSASAPIMSAPTKTSAGAVAAVGMAWTKGGEEERVEEPDPDHDARKAGTPAHCHAGGTLDLTRDGTRADRGVHQHRNGIGQQDSIEPRYRPVLRD